MPKFSVATWSRELEAVERECAEAERLGFHGFYYGEGLGPECWTTLTALALKTKTIRLGPGINFFTYRSPVLLAKIAATLDLLSGGRLDLKLGAGGSPGFGVRTPSPRERIAQLKEGLMILKALWTEGHATFTGSHYRVEEAVCSPKPIQRPHPPIIVAAKNEQMLRLAAEHSDGLEGFYPPRECAAKLEVFGARWRALGRGFEPVRSVLVNVAISSDSVEAKKMFEHYLLQRNASEERARFLKARDIVGAPADCEQKIAAYLEAGVTHFTLIFIGAERSEPLELFAEQVMPGLRE